MSSFTNPTTLFHPQNLHLHHQNRPLVPLSLIRSSFSGEGKPTHHHHRRNIVTTLVATSIALGLHQVSPVALAQSWGTRSFLRERFFEPGLSPEDAAARIRQTAEGLHSIREMLETMSWRYVLFYIRLKQSYLSQDMQNAMSTVPENRRQSYVNAANELVDNMAEMLENFGFGTTWTKWIKGCISSARVSVLVDGSPSPKFYPQKGIRQGDLLSPFLFNVVAEGLNILISRAKDMGLFKGISIGDNGFNISHLQFVDDTVIFCKAEWSEILAIKRILRCFEVISSLRINFYKSVVCEMGVAVVLVEKFAAKLNCLSKKLPLKYLGLPLGASPSKRLTWRSIVENFKKKLSGWKRRVLSFAGRVTLTKSALSALPVYYMSLFKMPECVTKEIDRIQASFL